MNRIYLDWAATAAPDKNIINQTAEQSLLCFGNPSSPHQRGKDAAELMKTCRKSLAKTFGAQPQQLFLTSGGTDSNNIVFSSLLMRKRTGNIVISGIEHSSVYEPAMMMERFGWEVRIINPEPNGILSADKFCSRIDENTRLASVIMINNETGAVQPVNEIGRIISTSTGMNRVHYHIDAVQAAGKYPLNFNQLPVDSAAVSSHKFQGPRGTGLLYLKKNLEPLYSGGGQEEGIRHGTENTFGIAGTVAAAEKAAGSIENNLNLALVYKKILIERISQIKGTSFIPLGSIAQLLDTTLFSPYILSVSIKSVPGEVLVRVMSDKGFDIATGSACATGKKKKSRVMTAMGVSQDDAFSTIRISTGCDTTIEEITQFCDTFERESNILNKSFRGKQRRN